VVGCGGSGGGGPAGPPSPPSPPADPNTVAMQDNSFNPASRTVSAGTTVRWVNNGSFAHNTVSDDGVWASGNLDTGASFQHTFAAAGTFAYRCTLHAGMTGTVVVQ
jgi:plastocyanin